jgi:hypothetical protein
LGQTAGKRAVFHRRAEWPNGSQLEEDEMAPSHKIVFNGFVQFYEEPWNLVQSLAF